MELCDGKEREGGEGRERKRERGGGGGGGTERDELCIFCNYCTFQTKQINFQIN